MIETFTQYGKLFYRSDQQCETCGEYMTGKKVEGMEKLFCSHCISNKKQEEEGEQQKEWTERAYRAKAVHRMKGSSLVKDKEIFKRNLRDFKVVDKETENGLNIARQAVLAINEGQKVHVILNGVAGAGKTTLGMGMLKEILKLDVNKHCMFLDYQFFLEERRAGYNDSYLAKTVDKIAKDAAKCDVLMIDDLGAETSSSEKHKQTASDFTIRELNSILQARENRSTIITTNLDGAKLRQAYGERIISRILAHSKGYTVTFKETVDKRQQPVK
ncbi:ATP-binding protein [Alkalibacterium psychrotolerans]